jgi:hypothetical protein
MPDQRIPSRVLVIESGDDFRAFELPAGWDADDVDGFLNVEPMADDDPDDFLPTGGGEYGGGSV